MVLRLANNPTTDVIAMVALKQVIVPNTQLALGSNDSTGLSRVYINAVYPLSIADFPSILISSEGQTYSSRSRSTYAGIVDIHIAYYDRWDKQPQTLDAVYASVALDLERIRANIESNDRAVVNGFTNIEAIKKITVSPYYGELDHSVPDVPLVVRTLTLRCVLPEYDA
jgi:hypothetical protein